MDDLIKRLRALARGKHDDYSVALEALHEIERLRQVCRLTVKPALSGGLAKPRA